MVWRRFATLVALAILMVVGWTTLLLAQVPGIEYEKLLLPVVIYQPQPGGHGAIWVTDLRITNTTDHEVSAFWHSEGNGGVEPPGANPPLPSNTTVAPFTFADRPGQRGTFFFVDRAFVDRVQVSLRVKDLSRQSQTWGTAIPIAREDDFTDDLVSMNDVRSDDTSRAIVRVYSLDGTKATAVRLSIYGIKASLGADVIPDAFLGSRDFTLSESSENSVYKPSPFPGFVEISALDTIAEGQGYDRFRVDVQPITEGARIWAFASITNNETQHVTIVAPSL
jgi:hypothetical protein